uniref:Neurotransmitter-gated ion-channel ligand-binding domain-containing protein n=1 Tax=Meloidogyne floridensis TaxID=298350 RepID=A0A915NSG5_9BILA
LTTKFVFSSLAEERLIKDLFRGYNHLIRPVANLSNSPLEIRFSLALILLINVDEKNQIMQTNVWPTMKNPSDYENIRTIRVPPEKVWLPDIVLLVVVFIFKFIFCLVLIMLMVPPAIYKSSCIIDVEFFPFDEQTCAMIFGSWTFNKNEVIISYLGNKRQVELNDYSESAIWDLMEVPGQLIHQKIILIIPTVLMAFLSMLVFYLPAEANEKITLAISILLALVYFHHPNCSEFIEPLIYLQKQEKHKQRLRKRRMSQPVVTPAPFPSHRELGTEDSELLNEQVLKAMDAVDCITEHLRRENINKKIREEWRFVAMDSELLNEQVLKAMDAVDCITEHLRRENINKKIREEWRFVSMVIDRLLLYIFFGVTVGGTIGILCSAPNIFENVNQTQVITQLKRSAEAEMKF